MSLTKVTNSMKTGAPVNVLDYGADPTGVADSTTAFNTAIAEGSDIYIPEGTYSITDTLELGVLGNKRIFGAGRNTIINLDADVSLINSTTAFKLNNLSIVLDASHTATVIKLDGNTGSAYQMNAIDLSKLTIVGNLADCVAIHFKMTNSSYMAYNNMHDIAVVAEGVQQACILLEVDNSGSYIQGNTFGNLNLICGGVRYISNGVANDPSLMIGNYFDGTYQTNTSNLGTFELAGINNTTLWDSGGYRTVRWHKNAAGINWGNGFYELIGPDKWSTLEPDIFVHDGWGENVQKYRVLSTGVTLASLDESKAQRGKKEILDPCFNSLDPRFTLTGMSQAGDIVSVGSSRRSSVLLTNTVATTATSQLILSNTACTISKFPEFKIGFRKQINGFSGAGTPVAWNPRLDAKVGLLSDTTNDGIYLKIVAVPGNVSASTMSLCYMVGGSETVLDSSLTISDKSTCYLTIYVDDDNAYIKATVITFNNMAGALISESASVGLTTGFQSVARASLFDVNTVTLNPQFTLTSTDKEIGRAKYDLFGVEFICADL